jgi:hypothetical protein
LPLTNLIASLARTANPANSFALIEISEAISASVRTLARVFSRAPRSAGPITFVPFTGVRGSDRSERHSEKRQRGNCRSPDPPLRHHRDPQRQLALQEPSRRTHQPARTRRPRGSKPPRDPVRPQGAHSSRRVRRRAAFPIPPARDAPMAVRRRATTTADAAERLQPFSSTA